MTIHWLALGLSQTATGIERMITRHASDLLASKRASSADVALTLHVDEGAEWPVEIDQNPRLSVIRHQRRPGQLVRAPKASHFKGATVVHSFGGVLPMVDDALCCYTVYDWGPFRDRNMAAKARGLWCCAITRSVAMASNVYCYSPLVAQSAPLPVRRMLRNRSVHVIAPPSYRPNINKIDGGPTIGLTEPYLLFVGTAVPRKRLDRLVEAVKCSSFNLVLAGDGTERYGGPHVYGMGRVDESTLDALYTQALAVVLVSEYEGFGLPVLEAAAYGRRVIVSPEVAAVHRSERPDILIEVDCSSVGALAADLNTWVADELTIERFTAEVGQAYLPLELTYFAR